MNIFNKIKEFVEKIAGKSEKYVITKENLEILFTNQLVDLSAIVTALGTFEGSAMSTLNTKYENATYVKDSTIKEQLLVYEVLPYIKNNLTGKAKALEQKAYLLGFLSVAKSYLNLVQEINKNMDTLIAEESITLANTTMSGIMVVGILREIEIFINFFGYIYDHYTKTIAHGTVQVLEHKYQSKYVITHKDVIARILNNVINKEANYSFLQDVASMRKKQNDKILYLADRGVNNAINTNDYSESNMVRTTHGLIGFNIIGALSLQIDAIRHRKYQRTKTFKAKLEAHVALLRLSLQDMDPDSPEYQNLLKVIESYDLKISELDRQINAYDEKHGS